jgi:lysozyme family protein
MSNKGENVREIAISHPVATQDNAATIMYGLLHSFVELAGAFPAVKIDEQLAAQACIYLRPATPTTIADAAAREAIAFEGALAELVNKIDSGLDTGDLLADAKRASAALDVIMRYGDLVANAHDYFRDSGERYEKSVQFRTGWNACLDAISNARAALVTTEATDAIAPTEGAQGEREDCKCRRLGDWNGAHHPLCDKAPSPEALAVDALTESGADTGNTDADRIIGRLSSSDPDFDDCIDAVAFIRKLVAEHKGPDGFATWKDAAIHERITRTGLERDFQNVSKELVAAISEEQEGATWEEGVSAELWNVADKCGFDTFKATVAGFLRATIQEKAVDALTTGAVEEDERPAWRAHEAAIDAKALATAQEIALMWGRDRSHFVSRIQVAVMEAMRWLYASVPEPAPSPEAPAVDALTIGAVEGKKLAVWYGSMPESNGKTNWTAILHNGDIARGITLDRSEYPDRVRYEADRARWLIGELPDEPFILDYDADKHSGYTAPSPKAPAPSAEQPLTDEQIEAIFLKHREWGMTHTGGINVERKLVRDVERTILQSAHTAGGQS